MCARRDTPLPPPQLRSEILCEPTLIKRLLTTGQALYTHFIRFAYLLQYVNSLIPRRPTAAADRKRFDALSHMCTLYETARITIVIYTSTTVVYVAVALKIQQYNIIVICRNVRRRFFYSLVDECCIMV